MTTREAFLASIRATIWLRPYLTKRGFLVSCYKSDKPSLRCHINTYDSVPLSGGSCSRSKTFLFLLLALRSVLVQKLEKLSGRVLVQGMRELCNGRGDLQALVKNDLLALKADVFRPFHEASQVSPGTDILT